MNTAKLITLGLLRGSGAADTSASFTATTTGAQTLTISDLTVSASTTVDWGDGSSNAYTGAGARTHNYAGAGTWNVRILNPLNVTILVITNANAVPIVITSAFFTKMSNMLDLRLASLVTGSSVSINSSDITAWRPTRFMLRSMIAGTAVLNLADFAAWNPTFFEISAPPVGYTISLAASNFNGWVANNAIEMGNCGFSQAQVDAVLLGLYTAAQSRTANGGTITLSGSNAAPSGTYTATCPPLTGKATAYELINDSCGVIAAGKEWTSITVTGGLP